MSAVDLEIMKSGTPREGTRPTPANFDIDPRAILLATARDNAGIAQRAIDAGLTERAMDHLRLALRDLAQSEKL